MRPKFLGHKKGEKSGREDLNLRPHGPKPCALTVLSYAPNKRKYTFECFDRQGHDWESTVALQDEVPQDRKAASQSIVSTLLRMICH